MKNNKRSFHSKKKIQMKENYNHHLRNKYKNNKNN